MPLRIGLTGGIGSGKTIVSYVFKALGVPVYYSDLEAKRLMNEDVVLKAQIRASFGEEAYLHDRLNRPYLASLVFGNKEKLDALNALVHPVTIHDSERWMRLQTGAYAIKEAALIFESGADKQLDYIIGVSAPVALRIRRVTARDNITAEQVQKRMNNQFDDEEKLKRCDFIIVNDEHRFVVPQVLKIHETLLNISLHS